MNEIKSPDASAATQPRRARFASPGWHSLAALLVIAGAFVAVGIAGSAYLVQLATDILIATALAYGWNLISGFTGYLSFGQVSFYGIGAYTTALLVVNTPVPWYLAVCLGAVLAMVVAVLLGPILLRVRGILFALSMFGLARILAVGFSDWSYAGGGNGMTLPAQLTPYAVYGFGGAVALLGLALNAGFAATGPGLDAMGIREDEGAAAAVGVPTTRVKVIAFALSALLAGLAGGLVAWNRSYIDPPSMLDPTIDLQTVVFVLFGGIGTIWGPLIGAVVLTLVGEAFLVYLPDLQLALYGLVVIVTVLLLPGGLVSLVNRWGWLRRPIVLVPRELPAGEPPAPRPLEQTATPVLEVERLTVRFDGLLALNDVSFRIGRGETVAIIGANGAGKTTLFNAITGFVTPTGGDIRFDGRSVVRLGVFRRARLGMARTFQIPRLMRPMTVWENVLAAARHGRQSHRAVAHAAWVIRTAGLAHLWLDPVGRLSPGHQRQIEFARVLALNPDLVLLDEVMAGMTQEEQEEMRAVIRHLGDFGVSAVAMVEHVIAAIADLADRMIVLDFGVKIAEDVPERVLRDPEVVRAYLGEPQ
ncbi:MAG TPA: branched-chain amino acid ABC transporter ATP-binding protein/permease [Acetobacteraceae bacterium]|nr:branched-chain amino acid ABC transporter ATP-binding protein/permease [Acetobacteraceae bacterium]